jgi:hypothetical protein
LNATGQVASATALAAEERVAFEEFKRAWQQQRHQQQQQEQGDECAKITAEFDRWNIDNPSINPIQEVEEFNNVNTCNPTPLLYIHLEPVGKPTFRIKVLADTGSTRSLISLSTAAKHGCKIKETSIKLRAANGTKIDVAGTTSLQVVEKGHLVHTIVAIVLPNVQQTIIGWQNLRAMGVIHAVWPTMLPPPPTTKDTICAVDEEKRQLGELKIKMLTKYSTVFSDTINEKLIAGAPMKIHLRDDIEITPQKCYVAQATPVHQQAAATKQELEAAEIIQKVDKPTAWTSPGFFVPKPNGGVRLVTDYAGPRGLNSQILRPTHPFPVAHDIIQAIPPSAKFFATAVCVHGYFQRALAKESRDLTTFMLPSGRWQYLRGPMGLSTTLDDWCRKSNFVIEGNANARKIVDNILCWGATMEELMSKLDTILMQCKAIEITLSIKKFKISKEVAFAGYVVKQGAISTSSERAIAFKEFPRPDNLHELRSFLGLAQQLAGFVPDLAPASEPLRHLLKKEKKWIWSHDLQDSFDAVVKILTCDLY